VDKSELKAYLVKNYQQFINYVDELTLDEYDFAPDGKWTAGQQTEHLIKSTNPIVKGLGMPKFVLKLKFGKANRESKTYDELVAKYQLKLEQGGKSTNQYNPKVVPGSQRQKKSKQLLHNIELIASKLASWSEEDLDNYIVAHPLLGKITVRELFYFSAYHAHHHQLLIKHYLKGV
jgi:DinB family protein